MDDERQPRALKHQRLMRTAPAGVDVLPPCAVPKVIQRSSPRVAKKNRRERLKSTPGDLPPPLLLPLIMLPPVTPYYALLITALLPPRLGCESRITLQDSSPR
jgi:hypothetical protein